MRTFLTSLCCLILLSTVVDAKIVFKSIAEGFTGMYVMDDDGSNVTLLIRNSVPRQPCWSPDGKQIVYEQYNSLNGRQYFSIAIMNSDGSKIRNLTSPDTGSDYYPSFSPDGKQVLFSRYQGKNRSINVLNLESGEIRQISDIGARSPRYSPNGEQITFIFNPSGNNPNKHHLWIMDAEGNNARQLIPTAEDPMNIIHSRPRWSPDGKQILYTQSEYIEQQVDKIVVEIHKAHRYMTCNQNGENIVELDVPKNWKPMGIDWMDDGESVVLSMREIELNNHNFIELLEYHIYQYHLGTEKLTEVTNPHIDGYEVDWISGDALSVSPEGKKRTQWAEIKKDSLDLGEK